MMGGGSGKGSGADDGGYANQLGGDHFAPTDFAKVDFDKPLFGGGGKDSSANDLGDGGFMPRSSYSSNPKGSPS